jgi:hypothetical protein
MDKYALAVLVFQARGAPDQNMIQAFAGASVCR